FFFFFFNDTATTEIYTLSLHDALPISHAAQGSGGGPVLSAYRWSPHCSNTRDRRDSKGNEVPRKSSRAIVIESAKADGRPNATRRRVTPNSCPFDVNQSLTIKIQV